MRKLTQRQFEELLNLIEDMGWDFDRFSNSGQENFNKICKLLGWEENNEKKTDS